MANNLAARVFDVPELLEAILLQLPIRHLHCAARHVCNTWNALITRSSRIQKALFLTSGTQHDVAAYASRTRAYTIRTDVGKTANVTLNPLIFCTDVAGEEASMISAIVELGTHAAVDHKMYLTQPPTRVVVGIKVKLRGEGQSHTERISGITFGQLVCNYKKMLQKRWCGGFGRMWYEVEEDEDGNQSWTLPDLNFVTLGWSTGAW
ncbi:hypothetical protein LTR27_000863 [Elasticomyces elasticus]|nr:hypothetical protein LTR27_000863 [Elasticomyces elasticus]